MRVAQILSSVIALAVSLSACVGDVNEAPTTSDVVITTTTTTTIAFAEATAAFVSCMDQNGIDVGEIPFDANGRPRLEMMRPRLDYTDPDTFAALSECAGVLSDGALDLGFDPGFREGVVGQLAAFSRCMRARGVEEFPDPIPGFLGVGAPYPAAQIPFSDPELPEAVEACERTVFGQPEGPGE